MSSSNIMCVCVYVQEQLSYRGDVSPPHSVASDALSVSLWHSVSSPDTYCIKSFCSLLYIQVNSKFDGQFELKLNGYDEVKISEKYASVF